MRGVFTGDLGVNPAETIQLADRPVGAQVPPAVPRRHTRPPPDRLERRHPVPADARACSRSSTQRLHFAAYWAFDLTFAFGAMVARRLQASVHRAWLLRLSAADSARGDVHEGLDPAAREAMGVLHRLVYVSAILRRLPLRVEGESVHRRSGDLRRRARRAPRIPDRLASAPEPGTSRHRSRDLSQLFRDLRLRRRRLTWTDRHLRQSS